MRTPMSFIAAALLAISAPLAAGCVADLIDDNWNGRVVRRGDVMQLASAMEELGQDSALRTQMGNHNRERILRYSPEACAAGIVQAALAVGVRGHE
jgi:glycosyltransferase involved in cell wall biosynthesis